MLAITFGYTQSNIGNFGSHLYSFNAYLTAYDEALFLLAFLVTVSKDMEVKKNFIFTLIISVNLMMTAIHISDLPRFDTSETELYKTALLELYYQVVD